jgi:predicted DNA-binding antitoxin AbrB/MazE fold protein
MRETVEAIYENGLLRPLKPLVWVPEKGRVMVTVASIHHTAPVDDVAVVRPDEKERQRIRAAAEGEIERVDPGEWQEPPPAAGGGGQVSP